MYNHIKSQDAEIYKFINNEEQRQAEGIELIPSENYTSEADERKGFLDEASFDTDDGREDNHACNNQIN